MQVKKNPNKNLNRNRILYFQIGLSLVLLLLLISVEWKSYTKPLDEEEVKYKEVVFEELVEIKLPEKKTEITVKPMPKEILPTEANNKEDIAEKKPLIIEPQTQLDPDEVYKQLKSIEKEPPAELPYELVQDVPIFPGCEIYKENTERKKCMSQKLNAFISKHFDKQLASELGLEGRNVIYTQFKVSHTGEVIFIDARAAHPKLKAEAQRVIEKLPDMTPGKQRLKPVDVIFGLPINFKVD